MLAWPLLLHSGAKLEDLIAELNKPTFHTPGPRALSPDVAVPFLREAAVGALARSPDGCSAAAVIMEAAAKRAQGSARVDARSDARDAVIEEPAGDPPGRLAFLAASGAMAARAV